MLWDPQKHLGAVGFDSRSFHMRGPLAMTVSGAPFLLVLKDKASSSQVRDWEMLLDLLFPFLFHSFLFPSLPTSSLPFSFPSFFPFFSKWYFIPYKPGKR